MGRELPRESAPSTVPDVYGLPVFRTTKIVKERIGDEIRMLCGFEVFGQVHWTHISIMKAADLVVESTECRLMAEDGLLSAMAVGH